MPRPVQITLTQSHETPTGVTYSYAHSPDYVASLVITPTIHDMLGNPRAITIRLEQS